MPALAIVPILRWTVAVHAVADDQRWRSACACGRPLWPNAILPSGRCTGCGEPIGAPAYAVEAAAALAAVALASSGPGGWAVAAFAWWAAGMIVLAFVDLAALRPPYRLTVITSAGLLPVLAATGDTSVLLRAVTAAAVLAVFFAVLAVASCGQLGWGDVAIAVPLAAALGWHSWTAFAPESCSASAPTPSPCAGPAASPPGAQLPSVPSSSPPLSSSRCGLGSRRCGHDRQAKPVHEEPS